MKKHLFKVKQYLLSGVSYAIPFVACGGILIAVSIAFAPMDPRARLLPVAFPEADHGHRLHRLFAAGPGPGRLHRLRHRRPAGAGAGLRRRLHRQPGRRRLPGRARLRPSGRIPGDADQEAQAARLPAADHAHPGHPGAGLAGRRLRHVPLRRRSDQRPDDRDLGLAAGDGHRQPRPAGRRPRRHDRLRHGRPGQQGGLLLRRGHDPGGQLRRHGRLRRGHLHPAAGPGPGHPARDASCGRKRSARPG